MAEPQDLQKRLSELNGGTVKRRSSIWLFIGIVGLVLALGLVLMVMTPKQQSAPLATAEPAEFQSAGPSFGTIAPTQAPIQVPPEPPQNDELRDEIRALQSEIEALRNAPPPVQEVDNAQLSALQQEIEKLRTDADSAQAALRQELTERARQIQRLQNDLEIAQLSVPQPPTTTGPTAEDLRQKELDRQRQIELAALQARIASPIIAFGGAGSGDKNTTAQERKLDGDTDFVRNGANPAAVTQAQTIVNPGNTVVQGTMIQGVLETAIDSSLAGQVRAMVAEDVHAFDGSRVLIPRGSRLIGRYQSGLDIAQQRITIAWDRIILPDNQSVEISAFGGDALGRSGTAGFVDTRFGARFGSAALISLIGAVPAIASQNQSDPVAADVLQNIGENFQDSTQGVMGEYLSIAPVIYVEQGARITVMVDRDLEIF